MSVNLELSYHNIVAVQFTYSFEKSSSLLFNKIILVSDYGTYMQVKIYQLKSIH